MPEEGGERATVWQGSLKESTTNSKETE